MSSEYVEELQSFLQKETRKFTVTVLPDFFLDRIISLDYDVESFCQKLSSVVARKGGSIDRVSQIEIRGGNAMNTASALSALGVRVVPIICTDIFGAQLIRHFLSPYKSDLGHIKTKERLSLTTSIELNSLQGKANVMIRDVGSLEDFGPENLEELDMKAIEQSDYVYVSNWAGTRRFGTELAQAVFQHTKREGRGITYYDTSDPTSNSGKIRELVNKVLLSKNLDILSVNENEAIVYSRELSRKSAIPSSSSPEDLAGKSAEILSSHVSARIDLHATKFSATYSSEAITTVSSFNVPVLRATGSGDAWNAGNIIGDANKLSDGARLTLANAVAACYISNPAGTHPTYADLIGFLKRNNLGS